MAISPPPPEPVRRPCSSRRSASVKHPRTRPSGHRAGADNPVEDRKSVGRGHRPERPADRHARRQRPVSPVRARADAEADQRHQGARSHRGEVQQRAASVAIEHDQRSGLTAYKLFPSRSNASPTTVVHVGDAGRAIDRRFRCPSRTALGSPVCGVDAVDLDADRPANPEARARRTGLAVRAHGDPDGRSHASPRGTGRERHERGSVEVRSPSAAAAAPGERTRDDRQRSPRQPCRRSES